MDRTFIEKLRSPIGYFTVENVDRSCMVYTRDAYGYLLPLPVRACSPRTLFDSAARNIDGVLNLHVLPRCEIFYKILQRVSWTLKTGAYSDERAGKFRDCFIFPRHNIFTVYARCCITTEFPFYRPHRSESFEDCISFKPRGRWIDASPKNAIQRIVKNDSVNLLYC